MADLQVALDELVQPDPKVGKFEDDDDKTVTDDGKYPEEYSEYLYGSQLVPSPNYSPPNYSPPSIYDEEEEEEKEVVDLTHFGAKALPTVDGEVIELSDSDDD